MRQSYGGVGRNIADCLCRLGVSTRFISRLGGDIAGRAFTQHFPHMVALRCCSAFLYRLVFPARCYVSAVLAMGLCLSVSVSVCHKPAFY